jgi:flagellin-like protein
LTYVRRKDLYKRREGKMSKFAISLFCKAMNSLNSFAKEERGEVNVVAIIVLIVVVVALVTTVFREGLGNLITQFFGSIGGKIGI